MCWTMRRFLFNEVYTSEVMDKRGIFLGHVLIFVTNVKRLKGITFITSSIAKSSIDSLSSNVLFQLYP